MGTNASQDGLQVLISSLGLPIRLGVMAGGQADRGSQRTAEFLLHTGSELGTPVGDDVKGNPMNPEDMVHHQLGRFCSGWQFGKSHEMNSFGKPIHNGENGVITF